MKTERRHDLQRNELAARLTKLIERVKPHATAIQVGVVVLLVLIIGGLWLSSQSSETSSEAWSAYFRASERGVFGGADDAEVKEKLEKAAKEFSGSAMEGWALLGAADEEFRTGTTVLATSRVKGRQHFNMAASQYRKLMSESTNVEVRNRAAFNLAITHENLEEIDKAREAYGKVGGGLKDLAKERSEQLDKDDVRKFYDWYAKAETRSSLIPDSLPGTPGLRPNFDVDDPSPLGLGRGLDDPDADPGDVKLPSFLDEDQPEPVPDLPKEGRPPEPPAEDTPAEPASGPELGQKPAADPPAKVDAVEPKPEAGKPEAGKPEADKPE